MLPERNPRKRYKDQLKRQLAQAGISHQSWQQEASDRDSLRPSVRKASCEFEAERHTAAKEKRRKSEQHPYHPHPKPSSVQSALGGAHQELVSTATNEHARIEYKPSQQFLSTRNEPSSRPTPRNLDKGNKQVSFFYFVTSIIL